MNTCTPGQVLIYCLKKQKKNKPTCFPSDADFGKKIMFLVYVETKKIRRNYDENDRTRWGN